MIETALLIGLVIVALSVVGLVLIQQGKGADMGASFGSGASQTLFGSEGSGNFLTRSTWVLSLVFFCLCLGLAMIARDKAENAGRISFSEPAAETEEVAPVAPESDVPSVVDENVGSDVPAVEVETPPAEAEVPAVEVAPEVVEPAVEKAVEAPEEQSIGQ